MAANDMPIHELFGVPKNTPQYMFQSEKQCCRVLSRESDLLRKHGQYVIFSNVDEKTYHHYFIYSHDHARGYEHIPDKKLALVKLTTRATEAATYQLQDAFIEKLVLMGHANRKLIYLGTSDFESKDNNFWRKPDMSYTPRHLPPEAEWPSIVMETGYSTSKSKLDWNTKWWLNESEGHVKMVLMTSIQRQRREYLFQKWALVDHRLSTRGDSQNRVLPAVTYELVLTRQKPDKPIEISSTDEQLVLTFADVFARQPGEGEQDITFSLDDLKSVAQDVWHFEFGDAFEELG